MCSKFDKNNDIVWRWWRSSLHLFFGTTSIHIFCLCPAWLVNFGFVPTCALLRSLAWPSAKQDSYLHKELLTYGSISPIIITIASRWN
jgi:hypothetical protein